MFGHVMFSTNFVNTKSASFVSDSLSCLLSI